ncbi:MAG: HTH domain-containing protein, partial [Prevotellaceae bacterium]|jgi:predicted HTH transcriptional regulator|nr:HTH domain-containing protein [Prevotellaceae bacterium]
LKEFWDTINSNKVNRNIMTDDDVDVIDIDGKTVICIRVPRANYADKPIYINENPLKGTFKRNHEGDYHSTESELKAMFRDSSDDGNDGILLEGYTMSDIDANTLRGYRQIFNDTNLEHVWSESDDKEFLQNMGGYKVDRKTGEEGLTMAGLMMFGKGLPIRERFSNFRMDYLDMTHLIGDSRYSDRLTYDGRWENNLFNFIRIVLPKLTFDLKRPFRLEGMRRIDDTPVHKAVREAFTNSIIHADLMITGILRIEKRDNGFFFSNPGILKLPVEAIYEGESSRARNPYMQNMLRMIGYGENIGSGFPSILKVWRDEHWVKPELVERQDLQVVNLTLTLPDVAEDVTTMSPEMSHNVPQCPTMSHDIAEKLSKRQRDILVLLSLNPDITMKEVSETLGVHRKTILRDMHQLQQLGIAKYVGLANSGHWVVLMKLAE